jgi:hypothetical protein
MLGDMLYVSVAPIAQAEDGSYRRRDGDLDVCPESFGQTARGP